MTSPKDGIVPLAVIERGILLLRQHRVMLDEHLAELYGVPVKVLNQAVKRNRERFPGDFMLCRARHNMNYAEPRTMRRATAACSGRAIP